LASGSARPLLMFRAILWVHTLRLWRYRYSLVNMALNTMLWLLVFLLGALMFLPREKLASAATIAFWGLSMWQIMSTTVWLVGGWAGFALVLGVFEEHMLLGVPLSAFFAGRVIPGMAVAWLGIGLVYFTMSEVLGYAVASPKDPLLLAYGLVLMVVMASSYGLCLAALSIRIGVPGVMLDIMNFAFFVVGGIATPVEALPDALRLVALMVPYSHAAEIVRCGAVGLPPHLGLGPELLVATVLACAMAFLASIAHELATAYARRNGIKGIGRM